MKLHHNSGAFIPACGVLSPRGIHFAPTTDRVTCERCRRSPQWRAFYDRDQSLRKRTA